MKEWIQQTEAVVERGGFLSWLVLIGIALAVSSVLKIFLKFVSSHLRNVAERKKSVWGKVGLDIVDGLKQSVLFIWILSFLGNWQTRGPRMMLLLSIAAVVATTIQFAIWGLHLIKNWKLNILEKRIRRDPSSVSALNLLSTAIQAVFIIAMVLVGLSNLGVDITALLAGLGVGGIAVALAAQNVLGDLLASLSIVLDKPFVVGDFIVAGKDRGTVERIGIKTTRVRSLTGEQLVLSNKDILESRIQNFQRMQMRRVTHKFGVVYSTPAEKVEKISDWVKEIILRQDKLIFDGCYLNAYQPAWLEIEMAFFVKDSNVKVFMDLQQKVLLDIFRKFQQENVQFVAPGPLPAPPAPT